MFYNQFIKLRLKLFDDQEVEYNDQILKEHVYSYLSQLNYFKDARVVFNVEQMNSALLSFNES